MLRQHLNTDKPFIIKIQYNQYNQYNPQPVGANAPVVLQTVKAAFSSPLALVTIIMYTVAVVLSLIGGLMGNSALSSIYTVAANFGIDSSDLYDMMNYINGSSIVTTILTAIPSFLIVLGMWLVFSSAKNKIQNTMSTAGFSIFKGVVIYELVLLCIVMAIVEIALIVCIIAADELRYYINLDSDAVVGVFIALLLLITAIFVMAIIYYVMVIKSLNTVKKTIVTGQASDKISTYVAVLLFISGGLSGISSLLSFIGSFAAIRYGYWNSLVSATAALLSAAITIMFGVFLITYKGKMRSLSNTAVPFQQNF